MLFVLCEVQLDNKSLYCLISLDTCQIKLSTDQYQLTISRGRVYSSPRPCVLLKLSADQVLDFDLIAGSCQVKLLKTESGIKVSQIKTVSSLLQMFLGWSFCFLYRFCDYYTQNRRPNNIKKTSPQTLKN